MGLDEYLEGQTPLDEDEKDGLLIPSVTTKAELDEVEQRNIEQAALWALMRPKRFTVDEVLSEDFIIELHQRMLGQVWKWAGTFRKSNKNIGVDKYSIGPDLRVLLDDCKYWIANKTYGDDEIAIRFKYRLVSIHCFANGNGRHSRLMADIIIEKLFEKQPFTWGGTDLVKKSEFRSTYIRSLYAADKGDYEPLLRFARS
jgi:Fic-DOC domain mobile mystery protein B